MASYVCDHVHLRSPDPDAAARFYVEALGAVPLTRSPPGQNLRVVVDLGGLQLFIEQVPAATPPASAPPFVGLEHIALRVDGFDAAMADLEAKGVKLTAPPSSPRPGIRIAFIRDPDGVLIEILERKPA